MKQFAFRASPFLSSLVRTLPLRSPPPERLGVPLRERRVLLLLPWRMLWPATAATRERRASNTPRSIERYGRDE